MTSCLGERRTQRVHLGTLEKGTRTLSVFSPSPWTYVWVQQKTSSRLSIEGKVLYGGPSSPTVGLKSELSSHYYHNLPCNFCICRIYEQQSEDIVNSWGMCSWHTWGSFGHSWRSLSWKGYFTRCSGGSLVHMNIYWVCTTCQVSPPWFFFWSSCFTSFTLSTLN